MSESLHPRERIRKQRDFRLIYKKGKRYRGKYFILVYLPSEIGFSRVGVVASRKVGNAVMRNKAKRWMRTLYRRNKTVLRTPLDLIMIAKPEMSDASWAGLHEDYRQAVRYLNRKSQAA